MHLLNFILLILGILLIVGGVIRLANRSFVDGAVIVVLGLIVLAFGGFIGV